MDNKKRPWYLIFPALERRCNINAVKKIIEIWENVHTDCINTKNHAIYAADKIRELVEPSCGAEILQQCFDDRKITDDYKNSSKNNQHNIWRLYMFFKGCILFMDLDFSNDPSDDWKKKLAKHNKTNVEPRTCWQWECIIESARLGKHAIPADNSPIWDNTGKYCSNN